MEVNDVSVTLGIGGAPYQKTFIPSLLREGMLRRVFGRGSAFDIQDPVDGTLQVIRRYPAMAFADRILWAIWRRVPSRVRPGPPVMLRILACDRLWSKWIPACSVFHAWSGCCLASLRAAKRKGTVVLLENAARHPRHWHFSGVEECRRFGIDPRERSTVLPPLLIRRIEQEYEECDRIVVPSRLAQRSLAEFGLGDKAVVITPGVDTDLFSPRLRRRQDSMFRACFVGRVELAKGAGYLLQAWKHLALQNAELRLVGDVKPEMNSLLRSYADSSVRLIGYVPPAKLPDVHRDCDVFVFPSVNEGLAQVLLEAMASGLPLIASDHSGADDLITEGKEGFIVPVRDVDQLAEKILWCYQHREQSMAMGRAARAQVESKFTLEHYNQRQIALYRSLAA